MQYGVRIKTIQWQFTSTRSAMWRFIFCCLFICTSWDILGLMERLENTFSCFSLQLRSWWLYNSYISPFFIKCKYFCFSIFCILPKILTVGICPLIHYVLFRPLMYNPSSFILSRYLSLQNIGWLNCNLCTSAVVFTWQVRPISNVEVPPPTHTYIHIYIIILYYIHIITTNRR